LQGDGIWLVAEVAQMTVDQIWRDEELTALDRGANHLDDIARPGAAAQPSLRLGIVEVKMNPDEIRIARRDIGFRKNRRAPAIVRRGTRRRTADDRLSCVSPAALVVRSGC